MNQNTAIVTGSLQALAAQNNRSLAETFVSCDAIILVDTSGSMSNQDSRGGESRYDVACEELAKLQESMPGKIGVLSFSSKTVFNPGGKPQYLGDQTDLAGALKFAKIADVPGIRFVVISDGYPDSADEALTVARGYKNQIDTIYVGPESDNRGREFLAQLAGAHRGQSLIASRANELAAVTQQMLLGAGR